MDDSKEAYRTVIECGVTQMNEEGATRIGTMHVDFFGRTVEVFTVRLRRAVGFA